MRTQPNRRVTGAALLLVLWLLVLLTGVVSVFALSARTEGLQGRFVGRSAATRYAAEAGVEIAALHMQAEEPTSRWIPDGRSNQFNFDGYQVSVRVVDESAKVDINVSSPQLMSDLMVALGTPQARARQLAGAIVDWRDPDDLLSAEGGAEDPQYAAAGLPYGAKDRPFETASELRQVIGMDAALYARLLPCITVYTGQAQPSPTFAASAVLQAMGLAPDQLAQILAQRAPPVGGKDSADQSAALAGQASGTYSVSSLATRADGTRVQLQAAIRIGGGGGFGQLYLPLSWHVGESD